VNPRLVIAIASLFQVAVGGYMIFDGMHALILGAYFGPGIGPWGQLVSAIGLAPASMAAPFVIQGGPVDLFSFLGAVPLAVDLYGRVAVTVGTLWYLPLGTTLSVIQIGMLLRYRNYLR